MGIFRFKFPLSIWEHKSFEGENQDSLIFSEMRSMHPSITNVFQYNYCLLFYAKV